PPLCVTLFPYTTLFRSSSFPDGTSNTMVVAERIQDCFSTSLVAAGLHYYTTWADPWTASWFAGGNVGAVGRILPPTPAGVYTPADRKSTRLNSSHLGIS